MSVPFSVLVVDDNRDVADSTAALIQSSGYAVRVAYSGQQAIRAAEAESPDCVLLDINMPVVDGHAVARALRANPATRGTKLIAFTSYSTPSHAEGIKKSGFDYHLVKGIADYADLEALLNMLREIKKLSEQTRQSAQQNAELAGETKELLREVKTEVQQTKDEIQEMIGETKEGNSEPERVKEVTDDLKGTRGPAGDGG